MSNHMGEQYGEFGRRGALQVTRSLAPPLSRWSRAAESKASYSFGSGASSRAPSV